VNPAHGARRTLHHKSAFDFFTLINVCVGPEN